MTSGFSSRRSILIVEDHGDTALSLRTLLEIHGYEAESAHDAEAALAALRVRPFDIVLCDLALPGAMSGLDLAQAIKCDPALKDVALVAVTGFGRTEDRALTAAAGFEAHLVKPVELPVLAKVWRR